MCEHGNTKTLIINDRLVDIDSCILPLVKMFNKNGYETIASCCGHGKIPGNIALADGRFIDIHPNKESWVNQPERIQELEDALTKIHNWTKAYPLEVFPEPDFKKAAEVLMTAGISLDAVSASNMRHVIGRLKDIVENVLKGK